jgi:hypothetical protein
MWRTIVRQVLVLTRVIPPPEVLASVVGRHPAPQQLVPELLVVVIDNGHPKWACLRCPCGCGDKIQLSLNPRRRPRWSVRIDWLNRPTLEPSIHQLDGCRSHFWMRSGRIIWCKDDPVPATQVS